jgi:hypothetical protein
LERKFLVLHAWEQAGRDADKWKGAAITPPQKQRAWHSSAGNNHLACAGIEKGIWKSGVTRGDASEMEPFYITSAESLA